MRTGPTDLWTDSNSAGRVHGCLKSCSNVSFAQQNAMSSGLLCSLAFGVSPTQPLLSVHHLIMGKRPSALIAEL